jgi:tetratricopeptide (TPR) repeat protein
MAATSPSGRGQRLRCCRVAALWIAAITIASNEGRAAERCDPPVAHIVSLQGQVEIRPDEREPWRAATLGEALCVGDSIRVGRLSRAALALADDSVLRLDQRTTLRLRSGVEPQISAIDLLLGALYLFARRPRALEVDTPFVNAGVQGTEFLVRVADDHTLIMVFDGRVLARNPDGELLLASGDAGLARLGEPPRPELVARPRDAVVWTLYYPPILSPLAGGAAEPALPAGLAAAVRLVQANDYAGALAALDAVPEAARDARYWTYRAGVLLHVGRADEAGAAIERALAQAPNAGEPLAQRAIIELAQNRTADALADARRAVELSPGSAPARIALSYALQGGFDLERARTVLREAVERTPDDPLLWARLAELELSFGDLDAAEEAAERAVALAPDLARTQMVLGFAALTRIDTEEARASFERAIALDSANPLSRLGLGLARIRESDLEEGRREIEIAAGLDPTSSLIRSYLGKAYFEERRGPLAADQFQIAKQLDPNDPTPWFYDAIRKQSENRPVEGLRDLQTSIRLNDNRAVYRSRLLLDQDLATRSASLARIYDDLGFDQRAVVEASKSLSVDPGNWSAHRFLSDAYARLPRHEIARASELLQAQLLQPVNINPVQPSAPITDLNIISGVGPAEGAFNEFHSLFERNQLRVTGTGLVGDADGNEDTFGDEIVASGIWDRLSFSAGQFHFQTNGFRPNADSEEDIYNAFGQWAVRPDLSFQTELRHRETEEGDLALRFDPDLFFSDRRETRDRLARLGGRYSLDPQSTVLLSAILANLRDRLIISETFTDEDGTPIAFRSDTVLEEDAVQLEAKYIYNADPFSIAAGLGGVRSSGDTEETATENGATSEFRTSFDLEQDNIYVYSSLRLPEPVEWTLGLGAISFERGATEVDELEPKAGVEWEIFDWLRLRAAYLKAIKRPLVVDQTIEPTEIAGFNQFFDGRNGEIAERYGVGFDAQLTDGLFAGVEISRRSIESPTELGEDVIFEDREEDVVRGYGYWALHPRWALTVDAIYEDFTSQRMQLNPEVPIRLETLRVPVGLRYFDPGGAFVQVVATYLAQNVERGNRAQFPEGEESTFLVDTAVGYRLPERRGILSLEIQNVLDSNFRYQDDSFRVPPQSITFSEFVPDRRILLRGTFSF